MNWGGMIWRLGDILGYTGLSEAELFRIALMGFAIGGGLMLYCVLFKVSMMASLPFVYSIK
jgi:hypothetical protein